mgnify:CR=1 FL=1
MKHSIYIIIFILSSSTLFTACKDDTPEPTQKAKLSVVITPKVNGNALLWDTLLYTNVLQQKFVVNTLKYFMSNAKLYKINGDSVLLKDILYVDGRDATLGTFSKEIEPTTFARFSIVFGIPKKDNVTGMFTYSPESNMEWPIGMGGGYHYMKFEGKHTNSQNVVKNFQTHTGPLAGKDYSIQYNFPINLTIDKTDKNIELILHLDRWMSTPNQLDLNDLTMIMGNAEMQAKLQTNGQDVLELGKIK